MAPPVLWHDYTTPQCTARVALVGHYLISECSGFLDGPLATMMVKLCEPVFAGGEALGSFHIWDTKSYDSAFRTIWMDCMRKWGTKYFRDLNLYVPPGLARMGLSVAQTMRIGDIIVYKTQGELLVARHRAVGV